MRAVNVKFGARRDMTRIADYIADTVSVRSADNWYERIQATVMSLGEDAEVWPEADEAERFGINLRFRMHGKKRHVYRILYTYDDNLVTVHRVLHASQDWDHRSGLM